MTVDELAELHAKCFTELRPWSSDEFTDLLKSETCFICSNDHGFAIGRVAGPEVELLTIAIDPNHRRQGFAHQLMVAFEIEAKSKNAKDAFLEVAENNQAAIALYESFGFKRKGTRKDYYTSQTGSRITALVMGKTF